MTLKEIAVKNLLRRKHKTVFVLAGLTIGICTVVTVIGMVEVMTRDINESLEKYGANILVVPKSEHLSLSYGGISLGGVNFEVQQIAEKEMAQVHQIKNAANIAAVGPVVLGVVEAAARKVLLAGMDFDSAWILKPWWKIQGRLPAKEEVILGSETARVLNLRPGDTLALDEKAYQVAGILKQTGSQDDHLIFSRLDTAQQLLGKEGAISMAEVAALCTACPIEEMVRQISAALPNAKVMAIQQVVKGRMAAISQFKRLSYWISGVVLMVGSLVVLVTMMGNIRERTDEIGILRAIGFRKGHIARIVLTEASIMSGLAGVVGYVLGLGGTAAAVRMFTDSGAPLFVFDAYLAGGAVALSLILGLASSVYPAVLAANLDPNEALRNA